MFGVKEIAIHPSYIGGNVSNDIALIRLDNQVHWNPSTQPACLPAKHQHGDKNHQHQSLSGRMATVAGWGLTSYRNRPIIFLQVIQLY